jgi:hypothetical protein
VHEVGLLGRVMCLTYLTRADEAIAQATKMIELKLDNIGQAYYWRAWNYYSLANLPVARADSDRAKPLAGPSDAVFLLAGMIEHDQDDLTIAETDLQRARTLSRGRNCDAIWYFGLVKIKRQAWLLAGAAFEDAMGCYQTNITDDKNAILEWQTREVEDTAFKARQIASFEAALAQDQKQYYAAAFNAANFDAQGGNTLRAKELIEIAAKDPALADKVAILRGLLKQ